MPQRFFEHKQEVTFISCSSSFCSFIINAKAKVKYIVLFLVNFVCSLQSKLCTSKNRLVLHTPIEPNQNFCSSKVRHLYYKSRSCHLRNTFTWFTQPWYLIVSLLCNWSRVAKDCTHTSHNRAKIIMNSHSYICTSTNFQKWKILKSRKCLLKLWWYNKANAI